MENKVAPFSGHGVYYSNSNIINSVPILVFVVLVRLIVIE